MTKYIPCSREMLDANFRAAGDLLFHHLLNRPMSRILGGKAFILGGSTDLREESPGIYSGDLSGIEANEIPWWLRPYTFPPRDLALLADWKEKVDKIARLSLDRGSHRRRRGWDQCGRGRLLRSACLSGECRPES
ncbi:MAG: hypothetical protein ABSA62_13635 [Methyloceanibacter sp.]